MTSSVIAKAIGTAQRGTNLVASSQPTRIGATAHGSAASPWTGARQRVSTTPASIACASAVGIAATSRPRAGQRPVIRISTPTSRKAPTAADQPPATAPVVANMAAPGVDQARIRGVRCRRVSHRMPESLGEAEHQQPGGGLGRCRADRPQTGQHDGERAGEADQGGDDPGDHRSRHVFHRQNPNDQRFCLQNTRTVQ